ncbi:MarR family winged helix-turn-helix transcriptional regulator [Desertihabitans aurantiacus]|uniref:MarR family winged helix-turn-helix transcriptional regulator n=1 Tax=Desertihabitans aurantiacus TaxID=2282477 RepID=UPI000DF84627|nr:MarR family winged helix-turn-helix transcriptional regulator [Desertihabitans aurantiacus]
MPKVADRTASYFPVLAAERLDIALCRASTAVSRAAETEAAQSGVGVGQHLVLKMLAEVGPSSQRTLSDELRIDRTVMVGICDTLEKGGYVERRRDPGDRRAYAVTITDSGRLLLSRAEANVPEFLDATFGALSRAERAQLSTLLGKLLQTGP